MPTYQKLPFTVVYASSQDQDYPCKELERLNYSQHDKGWQSSKSCVYPQELVIRLDQTKTPYVSELQLLSHHFKIASRVEIYVACRLDLLPNTTNISEYTKLGFIVLDDNSRSNYQSRELKSVYLELFADFVKLVFQGCHTNELNAHNQVGIVALNVIGNSGSENHSTQNPGQSVDLAYDLYTDEFTSKYIHLFTLKKEQAIIDEDYILAKKLKLVLEFLEAQYKEIAKLQISKKRAIENDDFDTAQTLKVEIYDKRKNIEKGVFRLGFTLSEQGAVLPAGFSDDRSSILIDKPQNVDDIVIKASNLSLNDNIENADVKTERKPSIIPNDAAEIRVPSAVGRISPAKQGSTEVINGADELPIPTFAGRKSIPDNTLSATEDTDELSEAFKIEFQLAISVFGLSNITNLHSRKYTVREAAFNDILKEIESAVSLKDGKDMSMAACQVMNMTITDSTEKLVISGYSIWDFVKEIIDKGKLEYGLIFKQIDALIPHLIIKAGETNPRLRKKSMDLLLDLSSKFKVLPNSIFTSILKPVAKSTPPKIIRGKLDSLEAIFSIYGVPENGGVTLENVMSLVTPNFAHSNPNIRESCVKVASLMYSVYGEEVDSHLTTCSPHQIASIKSGETPVHKSQSIEIKKKGNKKKVTKSPEPKRSVSPKKRIDEPIDSHSEIFKNNDYDATPKNAKDKAESSCLFCGERNAKFSNEDAMDNHYYADCPLLAKCYLCRTLKEVINLNEHMLFECEQKHLVSQCPNCKEAILNSHLNEHLSTCNKKADESQLRCPLCHMAVFNGEEGMRRHLLTGIGCPSNPRKLVKGYNYLK